MTETHPQNRRMQQDLPGEGDSARADRRELLKMLDRLEVGDIVTVTRIDRLARSTFDLFGIIKRIVDAKAQFRSLAEPWADTDTGTSTGRLMIAVLCGLPDGERSSPCVNHNRSCNAALTPHLPVYHGVRLL